MTVQVLSRNHSLSSVEGQPSTTHLHSPEDPLCLAPFIKTRYELQELAKKPNGKNIADFYRAQNDLIHSFLNTDTSFIRDETQTREYSIAMFGSLAANCLLFVVQLTAAILSGSLALFATTADAFMDLASNVVLIGAGKLASRPNYLLYPAGKNRYKTAGIIVFATLMSTLSLQLVAESVKSLIAGTLPSYKGSRDLNIDQYTYILVGLSLCTFPY